MLRRLLSFFRSTEELDAVAQEELAREREEYLTRLERDPFRFADPDAFEAFRRKRRAARGRR